MDQERYDLVFSGELVAGFDLPQVKRNLQVLFRIDESKVEQLFSGKATILKKSLDLDAAAKYRTAMKKAGARLELTVSAESTPSENKATVVKTARPAPPGTVGKQSRGPEVQGEQPLPKWSSEPGAQPPAPNAPRPVIQAPDFGIAAVGVNLLAPDERPRVSPVKIDLKDLVLVEQGGDLLRPEEKRALATPPVQTPEFYVMPLGSDMLDPSDMPIHQSPNLDLSMFELAPAGVRLSPLPKDAPKPPPIDHLTLKK